MGNVSASNKAEQAMSLGASQSTDVMMNSMVNCDAENRLTILGGCELSDSHIKQSASCQLNNTSKMTNKIKNSITQTGRQSTKQIAEAIGQNFNLNPGNITASNIGRQIAESNAAISNKISNSCSSQSTAKNTITCGGSNNPSKIHRSTIDQKAQSNVIQNCSMDNKITNATTQKLTQVLTQHSKAISQNTIAAMLFAIAAVLIAAGFASKMGLGKVINYLIIAITVILIVGIIAILIYNLLMSKDLQVISDIRHTPEDYCGDLSQFSTDRLRGHASPTDKLSSERRAAAACTNNLGTWYNNEGEATTGFPIGGSPDSPLNTQAGVPGSRYQQVPGNAYQCHLQADFDTSGSSGANQCSYVNTQMNAAWDKLVTRQDPACTTDPEMIPVMFNDSSECRDDQDKEIKSYSEFRNQCIENKCLWLPDVKTRLKSGPNKMSNLYLDHFNSDIGAFQNQLSQAGGSSANANFNQPQHQQGFLSKHWEQVSGYYGRDSHFDELRPYFARYDSKFLDSGQYPTFNDVTAPTEKIDFRYGKDTAKQSAYWTLFPLCVGGHDSEIIQDTTRCKTGPLYKKVNGKYELIEKKFNTS